MAILLCLAQTASAVAAKFPEKTASGIFFTDPNIYTGEILSESQQLQWKIDPAATPTASGRQDWLSADPIGEEGGLNLYGYVGGNPVNAIDPLGLRGYPSVFVGPLMENDYYIPDGPPGASVANNCNTARGIINPLTFRNHVKNKGPWDYKQKGRKYADFGNYNYGAAGRAYGFSLNILLNEA